MHHHFRPGGVRRVIELATPHLVRGLHPPPSHIILASGEAPGKAWLQAFKASVRPVPVLIRLEPALGYLSGQKGRREDLAARIRRFLERLLAHTKEERGLVWAHNPGLGRNILLTAALQRACSARRLPLVFHHHDWWFDNRWARWPEMHRCSMKNVAAVGQAVLSVASPVKHVAINRSDAAVLQKHLGAHANWLPNPTGEKISGTTLGKARRWLQEVLGEPSPVWLMPCRLLRRKNIAEALLLTRWLRPGAWLVTTGGVTSPDEQAYCSRIEECAKQNQWRIRLAVLENRRHTVDSGIPSVHELLAASETALLTSLQEGFGLAYLETAAAGRPLIARTLDNIMPDLALFGFRFPQSYARILVHPSLFDWDAEIKRQARLFSSWRSQIPRACRGLVGTPRLLLPEAKVSPTPFNRLTLTAQLEVLRTDPEISWKRCVRLNPFLDAWRNLSDERALRVTVWPRRSDQWLSGPAYARRFQKILNTFPTDGKQPLDPKAAVAAQEELMRQKLAAENLYPLLWSPET